MEAIQLKIKTLEEQVLNGLLKIEYYDRENKELLNKLIAEQKENEILKKKLSDEIKRADILKIELLKQKDISREIAKDMVNNNYVLQKAKPKGLFGILGLK
jgi:hypothetical protein